MKRNSRQGNKRERKIKSLKETRILAVYVCVCVCVCVYPRIASKWSMCQRPTSESEGDREDGRTVWSAACRIPFSPTWEAIEFASQSSHMRATWPDVTPRNRFPRDSSCQVASSSGWHREWGRDEYASSQIRNALQRRLHAHAQLF